MKSHRKMSSKHGKRSKKVFNRRCRKRKTCRKNKQHRTKRHMGGDVDLDLEMGPEIQDVEPYAVPPDPQRFEKLEQQMRMRPGSPEEVDAVFSGPTPEQKQEMERNQMEDEDSFNKDPFSNEDLKIFSSKGGKLRRRRYARK